MKKRLLSLALALVMVCGLLPVTATAAATVTEIVPPKYDEVEDFHEGLAPVCVGKYSDSKWGFIDKTGAEVVPCKYGNVNPPEFHEGLAAVRLNDKWGFIDATDKEVVPCQYSDVNNFSEGLAAVKVDTGEKDSWHDTIYKYGFIDKTGREVVPPKYYMVGNFSEGLAWVRGDTREKNERFPIYKYGFIDKTGKEVIPCKYDYAHSFSEGLAAVCVGNWPDEKWGFIDTTGKEVVPCKYDEVKYFDQSLAAVRLDGKWGFIDKTGKEVAPCKYDDVEDFSDGLAAVRIGDNANTAKWGFIDTTGKEVVPCNYSYAPEFHDGVAIATASTGQIKNGQTVYAPGVIDAQGNVVVPFGKYDEIGQFSDGLAAVRITVDTGKIDGDGSHRVETKQGFIDTTGKEVVPLGKYWWIRDFSEGLAGVGESVFIDTTGKEVVVLHKEYNRVRDFSEGLAAVYAFDADDHQVYKWGFVDKTGAEVVPCKYINDWYNIPEFHDGLAMVQTSNGWGCIDLHGNEVVPCQYGRVRRLSAGLVAVQLDEKWGILRVEGLPTEPKPAPAPTPTPTPQQPTTPASTTAYASTQTVTVDGKPVTFYAYALKDANGNDTNYIKLRDVAQILNGSAAQFQVGWDGSITITTKAAYTPNGTENIQNFKGNQTYAVSTSPVTVNGQPTNLEAITLTDANGGGYTYFKLRDLGAALGFDVDWTPEKGITVDSTKPYDGNN